MAGRPHIYDSGTLALYRCDTLVANTLKDEAGFYPLTLSAGTGSLGVSALGDSGKSFAAGVGAFSGNIDTSFCNSALGAITVEAWVNLGAWSAQGAIVYAWANASARLFGFQIESTRQLSLIWGVNGSVVSALGSAATVIPLNTNTHVAARRNANGSVDFFVNGQLVNSTGTAALPTVGAGISSPFIVLGSVLKSSVSSGFNGLIDDVRVTNFARPNQDILNSYQLGAPGVHVAKIMANHARQVDVIFDTPPVQADALKVANYTLSGATVSKVVALSDTIFRLTTSKQVPGTTFSLSITNIRDAATLLPPP